MRQLCQRSVFTLLLISCLFSPAAATEQKPEAIVEKMSFKLVRGVTNVFTSPIEIPKQTIQTVRRHGTVGYVVGPVKGVGMMLYRGLMGLTETILFPVPQPGYYEPMVDPEFVWNDWEQSTAPTIQKEQQEPLRSTAPEQANAQ